MSKHSFLSVSLIRIASNVRVKSNICMRNGNNSLLELNEIYMLELVRSSPPPPPPPPPPQDEDRLQISILKEKNLYEDNRKQTDEELINPIKGWFSFH